MTNNSAADCSISLKFGTEFDLVTPDLQQTFKVKCQRRSQRNNVIWSPNYCSFFMKSGSLNLMVMAEFWSEARK